MKLYLIIRPSMKGTTIPVYYYTFADNTSDAIFKVEMKWGGIDKNTTIREIKEDDMKNIVIATDYFG